ncbi:related to methionine-R-sulfoxide reductase [Melanopsichium pennsylvanicum]|uniref:Related to methionine-R-sulfoxide reductase n=1 Tax=Melanopsichium pennsylvanicum TaxID=63383 RepID=A0AAJ4XTN7_9BASI|nr:related to methionine-R-sulfoxide reductase [Melanopsichium pennsylvanicum]
MVHADAAALPSYVVTKTDFYDHLESSLISLIDPGTDWISSLSNASSLIFNSMNRFSVWSEKKVNWAGFYLLSPLLPSEIFDPKHRPNPTLLLGPFNGLPACQVISSVAGKGVCADASALLPPRVINVKDTEKYPGHIACDSLSKSEIVIPLVMNRNRLNKIHQQNLEQQSPQNKILSQSTTNVHKTQDKSWSGRGDTDHIIIGVLDIDCQSLDGFDQQDEHRLKNIANLIVQRSAW